jgi:hypothetical protein
VNADVDSLPELAAPPPRPIKRAPWYARFAITMALFGCLAGMAWAVSMNQEPAQPKDKNLERVTPPAASEAVPAQTPVIVDVVFGFDADLTIDGVPIKRRYVKERVSLGEFVYTPGPGKPFERFENGLHTAQVIYWPKSGTKEKDGVIYQWTFRAS